MPRAQRTKSAVHEALQRRAGQGPGASFSVKLDAPPQPRLLPHRFHTGVFRSCYVTKHTQAPRWTRFEPCGPHEFHHSVSAMRSPSMGVG